MIIEINGLRCYAHHGVMAQERTVGNEFEVTLRLFMEQCAAVDTDDLSATVNYAEMCDTVREVMAEPSLLLERVCGRLRDAVRSRFPQVDGGEVRVAKLVPPIASVQLQSVAVTLKW